MDKNIGKSIQAIRVKRGLTQEELAKQADIKYTTLTKIESSVIKQPSVQIVAKIARALNISIEELL